MTDQILSTVLDKFKLALETLEKLECLPLKQRLTDCLDYIREMGQANEIEHFQNIKVKKYKYITFCIVLYSYPNHIILSGIRHFHFGIAWAITDI